MASYTELADLRSDGRFSGFADRVSQALTQKAFNVVQTTPTATELTWALGVMHSPRDEGSDVVNYVLASAQDGTPAITVDDIFNASDASVQAFVDDAVDKLWGV